MSAEEVAQAFVQHFYQTFDSNVESLAGLFVSFQCSCCCCDRSRCWRQLRRYLLTMHAYIEERAWAAATETLLAKRRRQCLRLFFILCGVWMDLRGGYEIISLRLAGNWKCTEGGRPGNRNRHADTDDYSSIYFMKFFRGCYQHILHQNHALHEQWTMPTVVTIMNSAMHHESSSTSLFLFTQLIMRFLLFCALALFHSLSLSQKYTYIK